MPVGEIGNSLRRKYAQKVFPCQNWLLAGQGGGMEMICVQADHLVQAFCVFKQPAVFVVRRLCLACGRIHYLLETPLDAWRYRQAAISWKLAARS